MAIIVCPECGEMCRDYDRFCPTCGAACSGFEGGDCDGNCFGCEHDMPHGCTKPAGHMPFVSPYPHSIVEKKGKYVMIEESDKRNKIGTVALALLPTGAFGLHDFYSRYYLRGLAHIGLISIDIIARVCSIPIYSAGLLLSWGLAVLEAVLIIAGKIKTDGKGFPFS